MSGRRSTIELASILCIAGILCLATSCSDDDGTGSEDAGVDVAVTDSGQPITDSGVVPDSIPSPDSKIVPPPDEITCNDDCKDFVYSRIIFPDSSLINTVGWDYDGDGILDNALGSILGAVASMGGSVDLQPGIDQSVYQGDTLMLLRLQAPDFANADPLYGQAFVGAPQACCPGATEDQCQAAAEQTCFSGSHTFYVDESSPDDALFGGTIVDKDFVLGPSTMQLNLPLGALAEGLLDVGDLDLSLTLKWVYLAGILSDDATSISNGVLAGVLTQDELNNKLIPTVATLLNLFVASDPTNGPTILQLFDVDGNGEISAQEVADNDLLQMFLGGDVDVDGDGEMELSLAVAFEAVGAIIDDGPAPQQDGGVADDAGVAADSGGSGEAGAVDGGAAVDAGAGG